MEQVILTNKNDYQQLDEYLLERSYRNILLVCGKSFRKLELYDHFSSLKDRLGIDVHIFDDIRPNPLYESAVEGIKVYKENGCDCIVAVGGGSPMDIAKCIKLFMYMDESIDYLEQEIIANDIPFIAIPTTAGTGSESTRFAIIYHDGQKVTVQHESSIPEAVLFDPGVLNTLSDYQKKATMMDALSHAVESAWSVKETDESLAYSCEAIRLVTANKDAYLSNMPEANENMLKAAYIAGKAINITQSTAGHAMCYKLTGMYGLAHGHSVALVMSRLYPYVLEHLDDYNDPRGRKHLEDVLLKVAEAMGFDSIEEGCRYYVDLVNELGLDAPESDDPDYETMISSVNPDRLNNNPVKLDRETVGMLYKEIFNKLEK